MNLNSVRVFVHDIEGGKRFYGEALGLPMTADGSEHGYCVFQAGAAALVVEAVPKDAEAADQALVGRFTGLSFEVPSAAAAYRDLRSRGVVFTGEPEKQFWGGTLATFRDPAGNELQLCEWPQG
jgi:catechol 2,3-dioxygenase-like lactoylglutathione lyase family enzyme